jgi:hypothetical protein
LKPQAL